MRIGIITQPLWENYGGILQNYALQQVLKKIGHNPITLDFIPGFTGYKGIYWVIRRFVNYLLFRLPDLKSVTEIYAPKRMNIKINSFIEKYIDCTPTFWNGFSSSLLRRFGLDAIIVGSDQVWRPAYNMRLDSMFLDFTMGHDIIRISYAASFGATELEYSPSEEKRIRRLLKQFDAVSVRESSGVVLVDKLGARSENVLDPTLLLGKEGFEKILPSNSKCEYLGAYILDRYEKEDAFLKIFEKRSGCVGLKKFSAGEDGMGPEEWINAIRSSKFFITDSYHGTIFCLLFHVPFLTLINSKRGADRFWSLLQPIGLENRLVSSLDNICEYEAEDIRWNDIDLKIDALRRSSMDFLINNLHETNS